MSANSDDRSIVMDAIKYAKNDVTAFEGLTDEQVFGLVCWSYYFNEGNLSFADSQQVFTDQKGDGGIDFITVQEEDQFDKFVLAQVKMQEEVDKEIAINAFVKMHTTVKDFEASTYNHHAERLQRIYHERINEISTAPGAPINISLKLYLGTEVTEKKKDAILRECEKIEDLKAYELSIHYQDDIVERIEESKAPTLYIPYGEVEIEKNETLSFGKDELGVIVNVKANSLKKLYAVHKKRLFEQNIRYYIQEKSVDAKINGSLESKRDKFWFLSNGLIIACKHFEHDGYKVKLHDFSIVNGCQTVSLIGEYKGENEGVDFVLACKIVKPSDPSKFSEFVADIAEASNSQKPISARDLKANTREQKDLQRQLKEGKPKIIMRRKRGELDFKHYKALEGWQKLDNSTYGQYVRAFHFQSPGTARNSPAKIFQSRQMYESIFVSRTFDNECIVDTLKIFDYYQRWSKQQVGQSLSEHGEVDRAVIANGKIIIPSLVGFLIKWNRGLIDSNVLGDSVKWVEAITADNLKGPLFSLDRPDDQWDVLFSVFERLVGEVADIYKDGVGGTDKSFSTVTNLFKSDEKYHNVILVKLCKRVFANNRQYMLWRREWGHIFN